MSWAGITAVTTIIGTIAVVVTLFYLAKQTQQAVRIGMAQEQRTLIDQFNQYLRRMTEPENLKTMRKILTSYRSLNKDEQAHALVLLAQWINHYEQSRYSFKSGLLPQAVLSAFENFVVAFLLTPGGSEFWQEFSHVFGADVRRAIDDVLADSNRHPPPITDTYSWLVAD